MGLHAPATMAPHEGILLAGAANPGAPFQKTTDKNTRSRPRTRSWADVVAGHHDGWVHFPQSQTEFVQVLPSLGLAAWLAILVPGRITEFDLR